jgi:hypothetical protein
MDATAELLCVLAGGGSAASMAGLGRRRQEGLGAAAMEARGPPPSSSGGHGVAGFSASSTSSGSHRAVLPTHVFTIFLYNNLCRLSNEHNAAKHHCFVVFKHN